VLDKMGIDASDFFRTFMVPGMFHCRGGLGTDRFDALTPVVAWTELGIVPNTIYSSRIEGGEVVRTRPLCPWPAVAHYRGEGNPDDAENFECRSD
jgi:feruloyl esterase